MKTKLATFVAVMAFALFVMGCASTQTNNVKTYHLNNLKADDSGMLHSQNERLPVTGRVVEHLNGTLHQEFMVENGLKHGLYRKWNTFNNEVLALINEHSEFENGKLVWHKRFHFDETGGMWPGTKTFQMRVPGWNQDGTPAEPGKEKAIEK